ncbi:(2Fe-2S)-binding protein [Desulfopila inferna]|uniref:(2Fe-2S)-binding protein n=1 Tax=Desulfopila inferna TaxID=468528 RepID=UPI001F058DAB|nr:(2Fe-2S)-binding protein [Desulfopila inferna]
MMKQETVQIECVINGIKMALEIPALVTALQVIRDVLGLKGAKEGCGIGECGACTIVVDGKAVNSCLLLGAQLHGTEVITVEGLATDKELHLLQEKFIAHNAVQCGFCTPGLLMSAYALLEQNPHPGRDEISKAVAGNLCRCTGYQQIITSIEAAVSSGAGGEERR